MNWVCMIEKCVCKTPYKTRKVGVNKLFIPNLFIESHCVSGDIALIELTEQFKKRKTILANKTTKLPLNNILYVSGYGYDPERQPLIDIDELKTAKVKILNKCPKTFENINYNNDLICADEVIFDQNVCEGDSGAAITDFNGNIFGLVSYGTQCDKMFNDDQRGLPNECLEYANSEVYTNVTYYLPFICGIIGINEDIGCLLENVKKSKEQPYFEIKRNGKISKNAPNFEAEEVIFEYDDDNNERSNSNEL
ncbi:Peptidase S1 domain-containing protein [Meloidogyne graminicola]|uniref:Peptidase S1 domain-containing protein n=1 Tax=Meloidogyne graminicola TaxID=189291 RepID=A0A8S9ZKN9_9BILA|nr:Peptidase S1 domain-containing protein [Meloidogyne graminicola]